MRRTLLAITLSVSMLVHDRAARNEFYRDLLAFDPTGGAGATAKRSG